ncbi:MAG: carbohydrate ABC transporter permease [Chloroflexota bacterium]|nr:carbohydrate ABC transporter permease [Chloroflexota bacterium]
MSRSQKRTAYARLVLVPMAVLYTLPYYWMAVTSLKSNEELGASPPTLVPHSWQWSNFSEAVTYIPFNQYLLNTLIITGLTMLGAVISNPIVAYGFSRVQWPGRDMIFYVVIATVFIPFPVLIVALFDIFAKLGWVNTFLPLVVPAFFGNAFWIFLMRQFLMQIPQEISDAAKLDGANELQVAYQIVLPLAKPAIAVVAIFAAISAWNDFLGPLLYLQDESKYTLSVGLTFFRSQHDVQFNLLMAASTLVVIPVVLIFLAFQRSFIDGLTVGSIK